MIAEKCGLKEAFEFFARDEDVFRQKCEVNFSFF